ncbi:unnamed protein product [Oppiella nova]|uniref:V-type proton ATPase subunit C n=1 Tax=Oppiella nova TaxID=334625 RepID=A0A7R9QG56_9ACAR|nr:unnamed protein product [Oppiella nova]CAG2165069.1 unnamed protein product [Oppiella nova]
MSGHEYWLISAPGEKTCQQTWESLNATTSRQSDLCKNFKFHIPDLKVGTLDQLVGLSDDLNKLDTYVEVVCRKLAASIADTLDNKDKNQQQISEHIQANGQDLAQYVTKFQWDLAKYPIKQSLKSLQDIISKQIGQIDTDMKSKTSTYNNLRGNLQSLERKQTGSLLVRNLSELVKRENFVIGSEYLTTLLVVVPKAYYKDWQQKYEKLTDMIVPRSSTQIFEDNDHGAYYKDWQQKYEKLTDMIVPRSSTQIFEDNDHGLFTITLFNKVVDEFKAHARENRFVVREFAYNEEDINAGKNEIVKLENDMKRQYQILLRWLKVNFSEAFIAWIHVKALRLFVESVLRYGLPVNFLSVLIHPNKRTQRKLRDVLNQLYRSEELNKQLVEKNIPLSKARKDSIKHLEETIKYNQESLQLETHFSNKYNKYLLALGVAGGLLLTYGFGSLLFNSSQKSSDLSIDYY